jgi:hypothetical protein
MVRWTQRRRIGVSMLAALALSVAGCGVDRASTETAASAASPTATASPSARGFDPSRFSAPTMVGNRWFPLVPGTRMTWEGHALDGTDQLERKVVFAVTDLVKEIDGVPAVVIWERDYTDGELEEAELSFFAQDDAGNVWHLGEYPEEYDGGEIVKHPIWIGGLQDARPGIQMPALPTMDAPDYPQGWGPAVGWNDRGQTFALDQRTCTDVGCYDDVVVIKEFSRDEPGAYQLKYYAPGVGNVRVGWGGPNEEEHEVLVLTSLQRLDAAGMDELRANALAQDARGYELSPHVYGRTQPAATG